MGHVLDEEERKIVTAMLNEIHIEDLEEAAVALALGPDGYNYVLILHTCCGTTAISINPKLMAEMQTGMRGAEAAIAAQQRIN